MRLRFRLCRVLFPGQSHVAFASLVGLRRARAQQETTCSLLSRDSDHGRDESLESSSAISTCWEIYFLRADLYSFKARRLCVTF